MAVTLTALPQSMERSEYKMALLTMLWRQVLHAADGAKLRDVRVARLLRRHGGGVVPRQHRHQHYPCLHAQLDTHMLSYDEIKVADTWPFNIITQSTAVQLQLPLPQHTAAVSMTRLRQRTNIVRVSGILARRWCNVHAISKAHHELLAGVLTATTL